MVMKVGNIHTINFRSNKVSSEPIKQDLRYSTVNELRNETPTFAVKTPQKYNFLGIKTLANGLKIYSYKLANGHKVTVVPMENSPTTVKNYVNVGSMNETDDIKGISHFLEHMVFNGTLGTPGYMKLNSGDPFRKVDKLGGWINASTNYTLTDYVNSTPMLEERDLEEQIKIMASMTEDIALTPEMIEKEKGPVCSEINMILDNPQTILIDQTIRTLFNVRSSADELVGGSTRHIKNLTREKVKEYYDKYYTPDNMNLVITGDVEPDKVMELVSKSFHSTKTKTGVPYEEKMLPINKTVRKDFILDKALSTEIMLGFAGPKNNDFKSKIIFQILEKHINSTSLGLNKDLKNINTYGSLGIEKVNSNPNNSKMIYYGANCSEENSEKALKLLFEKFSEIKSPDDKKLQVIKKHLLQDYKKGLEYSSFVNNIIGNSVIDGTFESIDEYENVLNNITQEDINEFIKKYFDLNKVAITVVHPETTPDAINANFAKTHSLSFKGVKTPLKAEKISEKVLDNNYKIGFYETDNDPICCTTQLTYNTKHKINPAVCEVLDSIFKMGSLNYTEEDIDKIEEEYNLELEANITPRKIIILGYSNKEDFDKIMKIQKDILYNPRITEETLEKAKADIRDSIERSKDSANSLYIKHESKTNPFCISKNEVLEKLDSVTIEDVKQLHQYVLKNAKASVAINIPSNDPEFKENVIDKFNSFEKVKPFDYDKIKIYKPNQQVEVLTKANNASQADIAQFFKFEYKDTLEEEIMLDIINTILTSSSIGLFSNLREKEQLAYSVYSDVNRLGDSAEISCHILTTTDNKAIGEISYDNIQKSINGFNRQIKALLNSEYTDDDLESAKRLLKASLINKEGNMAKVSSITQAIQSNEGLDRENQLFNVIDNITREKLDEFSQRAFKNPPTYSIVASKDTLDANQEYFERLKQAV